jgi:RecA-family ATPase
MNPHDYNEAHVIKLFDDAIRRGSQQVSQRMDVNAIMDMAYGPFEATRRHQIKMTQQLRNGTYRPPSPEVFSEVSATPVPEDAMFLEQFRPDASLTSMPPREFVGPQLGAARLFPTNAISLFPALGGRGKTTTLISIAAHIAAGKRWGTSPLNEGRVLMYFVEEDQNELNRKFSAATHDWPAWEREKAADNLRLVSLMGRDPHLTVRHKQGVFQTDLVIECANAALTFGAKLLVFDHLQGFADGDLNLSDTATALSIAASQIVDATKAAVVFTAHVSKQQIGAETVDAGFTNGSLAFENAARQVTGVIALPDSDAKKMGIPDPQWYSKLMMPKNSYGPRGAIGYLKTELVTDFNTVRVVPYFDTAGVIHAFTPKSERLKQKVVDYISNYPGTTKNKLDTLSGSSGQFSASKADVRRAIEELIDERTLTQRTLSADEKKRLGAAQQVKDGLFVCD